MQLDPALQLSLRAGFCVLFAGALVHKVLRFGELRAVVAGYVRGFGVTDRRVALLLAVAAVMVEAMIVALCAATSSAVPGAVVTASVLLAYAAVMAVNLARGNRMLDCGCSWSSSRQPVGYELVVRNVVLGAIALALVLPTGARRLGALDAVTVIASIAIAALVYAAADRLFMNSAHLSRRA